MNTPSRSMPGSLTKAALTVFTWLLLSSFFRSWKHWALGKKHLWRQGIFYPYLQHAQSVLEDKRLQTNHWTLSFSSRHKVITFRGPWLWNPGCLCFLHMFPLQLNSGLCVARPTAMDTWFRHKIKQGTTSGAPFQRSSMISPSSLEVKVCVPRAQHNYRRPEVELNQVVLVSLALLELGTALDEAGSGST